MHCTPCAITRPKRRELNANTLRLRALRLEKEAAETRAAAELAEQKKSAGVARSAPAPASAWKHPFERRAQFALCADRRAATAANPQPLRQAEQCTWRRRTHGDTSAAGRALDRRVARLRARPLVGDAAHRHPVGRAFWCGCSWSSMTAGMALSSRTGSANDWIGRVIGVLTLTPYDFWRRTHAIHHATSGNLDSPRHRRHRHADGARISRRARGAAACGTGFTGIRLVMFGIGPAYLFIAAAAAAGRPDARRLAALAQHDGDQCRDRADRRSADLVHRASRHFCMVHLPMMLIAASLGVWLFYVQHQFEHTVWESEWNVESARDRFARKLALRPAGRAALVHRKHRRAPCASSVQPHPVLPAAAGAPRSSRAAGDRTADAAGKLSLHPVHPVGRSAAAPCLVPRSPEEAGQANLAAATI